jgi:hypothetical protein
MRVHTITWQWVLIWWASTKHVFLQNFNRECLGFRVWPVSISESDTLGNILQISDPHFSNDFPQISFIFFPKKQLTNIRKSSVQVLCKPIVQRWSNKEKPTFSIESGLPPIYTFIVLAEGKMNITKRTQTLSDETVPISDMGKPNIGCSERASLNVSKAHLHMN